jgi:hypothetical protein
MSSLIFLVAMAGVGWLVLWTIRDPKEPKWEWWPIEWWPFDTEAEAQQEQVEAEAREAAAAAGHRAVPWRERRQQQQRRSVTSSNARWRR